ncbi:hypothetical protein M8J75_000790 [Diaphorina citri]|nr:hypothetical protein M8J75_000790 [Diaphorina citri]
MAIEDSNSNDTSNWNNLPSLILNEIFSYLEYKEKLQASSSCKQWRIAFHHTNQLPDVHFHIRKHDEDKVVKSNYIAQCIAPKVKHLTVSFDSISALCLQLLANILEEVSFNAKVKRVVLNPSHCSFQKDGAFIQRFIVKRLLDIIENSDALEIISLGCSEQLFQSSVQLLDSLVKHHRNSLKCLMLSTLRDDPDHYELPNLDVSLIGSFMCSIDYDYVSDKFLQSLSACPQMTRLVIHVHGILDNHPGTTEYAWSNVCRNNPLLKVRLNLIHAFEAVAMFHVTILKRAMPLSHLRVFFCEHLNTEAFNMIKHYPDLESVWWVDSSVSDSTNSDVLLNNYIRLNPLVIAAWRLKKLKELVFLGYKCFVDDIVAIMRLRKFQHLELAYHDIFTEMHSTYSMKTVISEAKTCTSEGDTWRPRRFKDLHPVLQNPDLGDSDEYILPIVQADLLP